MNTAGIVIMIAVGISLAGCLVYAVIEDRKRSK